MNNEITGKLDATGLRFALVISRFNEFITNRLLAGAKDALVRHKAAEENMTNVWVPGAWELPLAAKALAESGKYDAIVCLGCVIRGDTTHHEYIAGEAAKGIAKVTLESGVAIGFGVLTTENIEQSIARAGSKAGNKGADAAMSALEMATLLKEISG